jgi:hypothetical protein
MVGIPYKLLRIDGDALPTALTIHGRSLSISEGRLQFFPPNEVSKLLEVDGMVQWRLRGGLQVTSEPETVVSSRHGFKWQRDGVAIFPVGPGSISEFTAQLHGEALTLKFHPRPPHVENDPGIFTTDCTWLFEVDRMGPPLTPWTVRAL